MKHHQVQGVVEVFCHFCHIVSRQSVGTVYCFILQVCPIYAVLNRKRETVRKNTNLSPYLIHKHKNKLTPYRAAYRQTGINPRSYTYFHLGKTLSILIVFLFELTWIFRGYFLTKQFSCNKDDTEKVILLSAHLGLLKQKHLLSQSNILDITFPVLSSCLALVQPNTILFLTQ